MAIASWNEGTTIGLMGSAEQVSIMKVEFNSNDSATITISNTGSSTVKITLTYVSGQTAILDTCEAPLGIPKHYTVNYIVTLPNANQFNPNAEYQFKLITTKGNVLIYPATFDPSTVITVPSHTHSLNPIIVPNPPNPSDVAYPFEYTNKSLFSLGEQQTVSLVWSIAGAIYAVIAVSLVLVNRKKKISKELALLFLVDGPIFLLLPLFWLKGISFGTIWAQAIMFLFLGFLTYSVYHIGRLQHNARGDKAGTFTLFLAITVILSFITVFWATTEPMTIGLILTIRG